MPKPNLSISSPNKQAKIGAGPLSVAGTVTAPDMPADNLSVQVQLDEQPPVPAILGHHGNAHSFKANVHLPDNNDHKITVTVNSNTGIPVQSELLVGPRSCKGCA